MRLPTASGKTCALPPVAGTTISQHLGQNSGPAVATPPSVTPPNTPALVVKPAIPTAPQPWTPSKATSFTVKNTRTQKGAKIVDLDIGGTIYGTLAELPNGKFTVRDANGQGIGKQFGTSWLARKALADYLNSKQGVLGAPMPQPVTSPTPPPPPTPTPPPPPVFATIPLKPIAPPPPPKPVAMPKPAVIAGGSHPVPTFGVRGLDAALGTTARTRIFQELADRIKNSTGWNAQRNFDWKQVTQKVDGMPTEWDVKMKYRWGKEGENETTLASFVRIEGGFNVKISPEFIKWYNANIFPDFARRMTSPLPDEITFTSNNASRAMTSTKTFFNHVMEGDFRPAVYNDNIVARLQEKAAAKAPLVSQRTFVPADQLEAGYVQGKNITRQLTPEQIMEIHKLHKSTGDRGTRNTSDAGIDKVLEYQGWAGKLPALTDLRTFTRSLEAGDRMWLRGDTKVAYASQYKFDPQQHTGKGIFGNGTYSASFEWMKYKTLRGAKLAPDHAFTAARTANEYSNGDYNVEGPLSLGRLKRAKGTNVMQQGDFERLISQEASYWDGIAENAGDNMRVLRNKGVDIRSDEYAAAQAQYEAARAMYDMCQDANGKGVMAAMLGIDAIIIYPNGRPNSVSAQRRTWKEIYETDPNSYLLIINRSATVMSSGDMNAMTGKMPRPSSKTGGIRRAPRPASWQRLQPFSGRDGRKLSLAEWLDEVSRIMDTRDPQVRAINLNAAIERWYRDYERAVIRGGKAVTITFEESMGFEELFFKGETE